MKWLAAKRHKQTTCSPIVTPEGFKKGILASRSRTLNPDKRLKLNLMGEWDRICIYMHTSCASHHIEKNVKVYALLDTLTLIGRGIQELKR